MGAAGHDFPDAEAEASFQADFLDATKVNIEDAGHRPRADSPEAFAAALIEFIEEHQVFYPLPGKTKRGAGLTTAKTPLAVR